MMKFSQNFGICDVCFKHRGRGIDHSLCARIRQKRNTGSKSHASPKVTTKTINYITKLKELLQ